jgi:CDGSH-type Zn-finger protein
MTIRIRLRRNGPYVIESDDVSVVDWNGVECASEKQPVALCRCGASASKPFCDGSHKRVGFKPDGDHEHT